MRERIVIDEGGDLAGRQTRGRQQTLEVATASCALPQASGSRADASLGPAR